MQSVAEGCWLASVSQSLGRAGDRISERGAGSISWGSQAGRTSGCCHPENRLCRLLFLAARNSFCLICSSFCPGALSRCQWGLGCFTVTVAYFNSTYRNILSAESLTLKFPCQKVLVKLKKRVGVTWWARFKLLWFCSYLCSSDGL